MKRKKETVKKSVQESIQSFGMQSVFYGHRETLRKEAIIKQALIKENISKIFEMKALKFQNELPTILIHLKPPDISYDQIHQARCNAIVKRKLKQMSNKFKLLFLKIK